MRTNRRVDLHAIDATPARWRGGAGTLMYVLYRYVKSHKNYLLNVAWMAS